MMKKLLALLLAGVILACAAALADAGAPAPDVQAADEAPEDSEQGVPTPARAYVLVTTASQVGWLPLPEEGEASYPLKQLLPDGTEAENVIHLTPEGVYMEDSTCEGHDCVDQGMVTLENRNERILSNMIICLPNQVTLQLYTPEEVLEMVQAEQSGEEAP